MATAGDAASMRCQQPNRRRPRIPATARRCIPTMQPHSLHRAQHRKEALGCRRAWGGGKRAGTGGGGEAVARTSIQVGGAQPAHAADRELKQPTQDEAAEEVHADGEREAGGAGGQWLDLTRYQPAQPAPRPAQPGAGGGRGGVSAGRRHRAAACCHASHGGGCCCKCSAPLRLQKLSTLPPSEHPRCNCKPSPTPPPQRPTRSRRL